MSNSSYSVDDHFVGKDPSVRKLYDKLLSSTRRLGAIREEPKKTSIHIVNATALAGVEVRKNYILLNIKSDHPIESPHVEKSEKISARRYHHKLKLSSASEVDEELQGWLNGAYDLSG